MSNKFEVKLRELDDRIDAREKRHDLTKVGIAAFTAIFITGLLVCGIYKICLLGAPVIESASNLVKSFCLNQILYYSIFGLTGGATLVYRERAKHLTALVGILRRQIERDKDMHPSSDLDKHGQHKEDRKGLIS